MFTAPIDPMTSSSQAARAATSQAVEGKEAFLKMFMAQMSQQNPLNPVEDKDMLGQLAQFSALEQSLETNKLLEDMQRSQASAQRLSMGNLIGKEGFANTSQVDIRADGSLPPALAFTLDGAAENVTIRLLNSEGKLLRSVDTGPMMPGSQAVTWDGRANDHKPMPEGVYRMEVSARGPNNAEISARTQIGGTIRKVDLESAKPAVYLGDARVALEDLSELTQ